MNIPNIRLLNQQLVAPEFTDVHALVAYMGMLQAQEYRMMRWAVGIRMKRPSMAAFRSAYNSGRIVRTHLFRCTWQLVAAEDLRWMLKLCADRNKAAINGFTAYHGRVISEDEYNRAYHQDVRLQDDEVLVTSNFFEFGKTFDIDNTKYQIKDVIHQPYLLPNENSTAEKNIIVIMKDEAAIQKMMSSFFGDEIQPTENLSIKYSNQSQEKEAEDILERCLEKFTISANASGQEHGEISFYYSSQYTVRLMLMELYGSLFFLGIFLGILFLMATILIMYYKQLSEGYEDQKRFEIMQKVGMSTKEVKQTIRSQVLIFFFLPLIVSVIHMAFAFNMITMMFSFLVTSGIQIFVICTVISVVTVAIIYAIVYAFTSRTYYRIVKY